MKDLLEGLKHLIIRIVSIQNLTCLAKSNNITYDMGSQNIKENRIQIYQTVINEIYVFTFIYFSATLFVLDQRQAMIVLNGR